MPTSSPRTVTRGAGGRGPVSADPRARRRWPRSLSGLACLAILALLVVACGERIVSVVPVYVIELNPTIATIGVGETVTIEARLLDDQGNRLSNRQVMWSSSVPDVATVENGVVTGVSAGTATITASSEGKQRTAQITVIPAAALQVDDPTIEMSGASGQASAAVATVTITNAGAGQFGGLTVAVEYAPGAADWLIASLNSTTTPAVLTLRADTRGLQPGTYQATIRIGAPAAPAPVLVSVTLTVVQGVPTPSLTAVSPNGAAVGSTLNVTLTGSGFVSGVTSVSFGAGIAVNQVTVTGGTSLTANITIDAEAALGPRDVTVTNTGPGGGSATLPGGFTVLPRNPIPVATSIVPNAGRQGQSLDVVITGEGFVEGVTLVEMGSGITVAEVDVTSETSLTASIVISPSAALGARDVVVRNPAPGGGVMSMLGAFTVLPPFPSPTIASVTPGTGAAGTTLDVTITGTGFATDGTTVDFGDGVTVLAVDVASSTSLTATIRIDDDAAGPRDVTVRNPAPGGGAATLVNAFTITGPNPTPTITAVTPSGALRQTTVQVEVTGSGFGPETTVSFGPGTAVVSKEVVSATLLRVQVLIGIDAPLGAHDVTVTNPPPGGGEAVLTGGFTVHDAWPAPTLTAISPTSGTPGDTIFVTLTGSGFVAGVTTVNLGSGITVGPAQLTSPTTLRVRVVIGLLATPGPRTVTVSNPAPGGGSAQLAGAFTVEYPAPQLSSMSPTQGQQGKSIPVTISGLGIGEYSTVSFGAGIQVLNVVPIGPTSLVVNISVAADAALGPRDVIVTNPEPGGGADTLQAAFTVVEPIPDPAVTNVSDNVYWRGSGGDVRVTGSGFVDGITSVSFGAGVDVTLVVVESPTEMVVSVDIPITAEPGPRTMTVANAGAGMVVVANALIIENPPVAATGIVSGASGERGSTVDVVIEGANFIQGTTEVAFSGTGIDVVQVTVESSTRLTATIEIQPDAELGTRTITVTNPGPWGGGSDELEDAFEVLEASGGDPGEDE